ncbi:hypothetical protein PCYB_126750 [Plasmodium cynomolgi strain B]|uniref:Uncharacterized protein n=1 Tax=Plasmodium cynomolgi (strain B) TaxID=1120755 RepID=K6UZK3_PLACD|nr:hypothetical protein PCYB_126750 [Plasmodium cynomolgi strain B]GAB68110.1 hypothetical protein PCYB_126750 [Plasmodium cynomolgi strain B]
MKRMLLFTLTALFFAMSRDVGLCHMCTTDLCGRCCRPTRDGCENNFHRTMRGNDHSDDVYCRLCDCSNPSTVDACKNGSFRGNALGVVKYFDIAGCGHELKRGNLLNSA